MNGAHNSNVSINFYNDRVKEVVAAADVAEPFTFVPIKAGHMELVGGNAVVFGKITEGYDIVNPDVTTELTYELLSSSSAQSNIYVAQVILQQAPVSPFPSVYVKGVYEIIIPEPVHEGAIYFIDVLSGILGHKTCRYTAQAGDIPADIKIGLDAALVAAGMDKQTGSDPNTIYLYNVEKTIPYFAIGFTDQIFVHKITCYALDENFSTKYPILKCGAVHGFGIVYKDEQGRQCSVTKTDAMTVYIPFYSESTDNLLESIAKVLFKISHQPPSWAKTFEIVYYGNMSMDFFLQMRIDNITDISNKRFTFNIQDTITWTRDHNNRWKIADYVWQEGDRLRLVAETNAQFGLVSKYAELYDYEIEQTSTQYGEAIGGDWLVSQAMNHPAQFAGTDYIIGEVYRPRKGLGKTVSYGTGMVFDVGIDSYGHYYHKGDVDQILDAEGNTLTPASINNTANDSYKYVRLNYIHNTGAILPFWTESICPSDWWTWIIENKLTSQGFPFLDDLSQRQVSLPQRGRHGGFMITGTRTNNIAHFTSNDFFDLQEKDGPITGMREIGYTLKVLQMYKETSIYINRIQTFNPNGTEQFTLTDRFIGSIRPMDKIFGTQHPDSVTVNGDYLYYWDNTQGAFIRSAPNGQIVLDTKVKRWFKNIVKWIQENGGHQLLECRIGVNNDHEEIWITFRLRDVVKGIIFSEKDGRFKSRIDQLTEAYIHLGTFFAHLYRQKLWIMNVDEGQDYLTWNGVPTIAEVELIANQEENKNKVFNAIAVYADYQWNIASKAIVIPPDASTVGETMESNVALWDRREGIFYGEILKDENSKGNFATLYERKMNGRMMRGRYGFIKFNVIEHTHKVRMDSIIVFLTPSERSD